MAGVSNASRAEVIGWRGGGARRSACCMVRGVRMHSSGGTGTGKAAEVYRVPEQHDAGTRCAMETYLNKSTGCVSPPVAWSQVNIDSPVCL